MAELNAWYAEKMNYINEQSANNVNDLMTNQGVIFEHYGELHAEVTEGINKNIQDVLKTHEDWTTTADTLTADLTAQMETHGRAIQEALSLAGLGDDWEQATTTMGEAMAGV